MRLKSYVWKPGDEREMTIPASALEPGDALVIEGELTDIVSPAREGGMGMLAFTCTTNCEEWVWRTHPDAELNILRVGVIS
jgi:hypothetical protein